jgi:hypothetical protein
MDYQDLSTLYAVRAECDKQMNSAFCSLPFVTHYTETFLKARYRNQNNRIICTIWQVCTFFEAQADWRT